MRFIVECDTKPYASRWEIPRTIGITTTDILSSPRTNPIVINGSSVTVTDGQTVWYNGHLYSWSGSRSLWEIARSTHSSLDDPNPIYADDRVLWHPDRANEDARKGYCVYNMRVKKGINAADSFTFTIPKGHPSYWLFSSLGENRLLGISVAVRWEGGNRCLFFGRAVSVSTDIYYQKTVTCEGAYAFLNDVLLRPTTFQSSLPTPIDPEHPPGDDGGPTYAERTLTWWEYGNYVMRKHSVRMLDEGLCCKRSFRFKIDRSDPAQVVHELNYIGNTTDPITEGRAVGLTHVQNKMTGSWSYVNPQQYDMVVRVDVQPNYKYVCDYVTVEGSTYLAWRAPTSEEAQPIVDVSDNWYFNELTARSTSQEAPTDKRWTGVSDYTPVSNAIDDLVGTDARYIAVADATIGGNYEDPTDTDNNVRLYLTVEGAGSKALNTATVMNIDKNVVDISESGNSFETYTVLIPLDKNKKTLDDIYNRGHKSEYGPITFTDDAGGRVTISDTTLDDHTVNQDAFVNVGYIEKTVDFDDIDVDQTDEYGTKVGSQIFGARTMEVLAQSANVAMTEFSISMVDFALMSHLSREPFVGHTPLDSSDRTTPIHSGYGSYFRYDMDGIHDPLNGNQFVDIGVRVPFVCEQYGIDCRDATKPPWICTSMEMTIDQPEASKYTFAIVDMNYTTNESKSLSASMSNDKRLPDIHAKPESGSPVASEAQATDVIKIDDNHVVEFYPDREVHYVADGSGYIRSNIRSYELPPGTTNIVR